MWEKRTESWSDRIINIVATELLVSEWKTMHADESARELLQLIEWFFPPVGGPNENDVDTTRIEH